MSKELNRRRERLTLEVMKQMAADQTPVRASDIWNEVVHRVPLEGDELELLTGDRPRGFINWRWRTENLSKAGWVLRDPTGSGLWTLLPAGERAFEQFTTPDDLDAEAQRLADEAREVLAAEREERLRTVVVPTDSKQERVIQTARFLVDGPLKAGESMFVPGRVVWTRKNLLTVLDRLALGQDNLGFEDRLVAQLDGCTDDEKLLAAELVTVQFLPISGAIGERKKASRVARVLSTMERPVEVPVAIRSTFAVGAFNPGPAMMNNVPGAIRIIIQVVLAWLDREETEQERLLDDPLAWRTLVRSAPGDGFPSQRNSLLYLVHPYYFGPIVSEANKAQIRETFAGEIEALSDDVDRDVHDITVALQIKERRAIEFYAEPWRSRWQPAAVPVVDEPVAEAPAPEASTSSDELAARLNLDPAWTARTLDLIRTRRQVIFTGPPGTGKTYLARALGRFLADRDDALEIVQFHPSYSYEDFFEGYRPDPAQKGAAFALQAGPLRRLAERARQNPEFPYVLVIDEINRGNLSKIFGELYFLLEYRDAGITLLYGGGGGEEGSGGRFTLPANIFILGTMNTADRSIALLDAAMRRRFSFVELHPDRAPVRQMFPRWLQGKPMGDTLSRLLPALNALIPDDAFKIGPSYFMGADMTSERLATIWQYDILPLLSELHFGDGTDVNERYDLTRLLTEAQTGD